MTVLEILLKVVEWPNLAVLTLIAALAYPTYTALEFSSRVFTKLVLAIFKDLSHWKGLVRDSTNDELVAKAAEGFAADVTRMLGAEILQIDRVQERVSR